MITCREVVQFLDDFTAGQLPLPERAHVEHHLRLCSSCLAYLESYRFTVLLAHQLPVSPLPPGLRQRLQILLQENALKKGVRGASAP